MCVLVVAAFLAVAPFVYMLMASLKTYGSVIANNLWPWPPLGSELPQFSNYPGGYRGNWPRSPVEYLAVCALSG